MKKIFAAAILVLVTGCSFERNGLYPSAGGGPDYDKHRFVISHCQATWVLDEAPCDDGSRKTVRYLRTGCALMDSVSACSVGVLRIRNPRHSNDSHDWAQPDYVYARLYDWECPAGSAPPSRKEFPFAQLLGAPVACDDEEAGLPERSPLLNRRTNTFRQ
jgi:hypothetical protein